MSDSLPIAPPNRPVPDPTRGSSLGGPAQPMRRDDGAHPARAPDAARSTPGGTTDPRAYPLLANPHVVLSGPVDYAMYQSFRDQIGNAPDEGTLVLTLSSLGGDPEVARLMGDEVRLLAEYDGREILFLGKAVVYSAAATFMANFPADKRFLTRGTRIMIHERQMTKTINLSGPLKMLTATLKATLHEIEHSIKIEEEGFAKLVAGSRIDADEVRRRAPENWYIDADEARDLGLVLDVI